MCIFSKFLDGVDATVCEYTLWTLWKQGFELFIPVYLASSLVPYMQEETYKYLVHGLANLGG